MKRIALVFFLTFCSIQFLEAETCTLTGYPFDYDQLDSKVSGQCVNPDTVVITGFVSTDGNNQSQGSGYVLQIGPGGTLLIQNNTTNFNGSIKVKDGGLLDLEAKMTLPAGAGLGLEEGGTLETHDGGNDRITINGVPIIKGTGCNAAIEGNSPPYCANGGITGPLGFTENGIETDAVLPITLGRFDAMSNVTGVQLEWETISEENFDFFSIERSEDGENFYEIGTVPGNGNSTERIQYSYVDANPVFGTSFYRLNAIDFDGSYEKFQSISIEYIPNELNVSLYPNPGNGKDMSIQLGLPVEAKLKSVKIYNFSGDLVLHSELKVGKNNIYFDHLLPKGLYFAKIQIDNYFMSKKMVIN